MRPGEIPPGTLDLLILRTLERSEPPLHGFAIANVIQSRSEDILRVEEGSLYPALQRLLLKGWIAGAWGTTAENRRARYYRLTPAGRKQLVAERARFAQVVGAIGKVLGEAAS
jgi:PadR family transcriptional regulator PadR